MPPDNAERRPRAESGAQQIAHGNGDKASITGCPCGCTTKLPWIDDPDCVRHLPMPQMREEARYDAVDLGLVAHDRSECNPCRAVGA